MRSDTQPLVSCIMPTCDRRRFAAQAIRYFLRQDYPNRELIIVDDGRDAVGDLVPNDPRIRYQRLDRRQNVGAKRNIACRAARGTLIAHWDDDDWMADHRLRYQIEHLLDHGVDLCGLDRLFFLDPAQDRAWQYRYPSGARPWVAGGTLCYTRSFWERHPFPEIERGEDTRFVWTMPKGRLLVLDDPDFYVALIHPRNTSPKRTHSKRWRPQPVEQVRTLMGNDWAFYTGKDRTPARTAKPAAPPKPSVTAQPPAYSILMVTHNALEMMQMATLRTLRHCAAHDARLVVVDNASTDGTERWLDLLARRGDIDLLRSPTNLGHGPALEKARRATASPYLVTLDSDAFPLTDDWLPRLRERLSDTVKAAGILHHRDYIHPSCLMVARETLDAFGLTFLNEKDRPSRLDVAERISVDLKQRGFGIAGLARTEAQRRGSRSEPVYLGASYEGLVYHQWYTTRAVLTGGKQVDDVPPDALQQSLDEVLAAYHAAPREVTVVMGVRAAPDQPERLRNARAALFALNMQTLARWRYRIVLVEQDAAPGLRDTLAPLVDRYLFAYNPGPYNRGWAFNVGAAQAAVEDGVLCLIDADLLAPPDFLERGLDAYHAGRHAFLPYRDVQYLDAASTRQAVADREAAPLQAAAKPSYQGRVFTTSQGGCVWVDAALYRTLGGHDERFQGWGQEDREFYDRLGRHATVERLPGRLLHLDHPAQSWQDRWATANRTLYRQLSGTKPASAPGRMGQLDRYADEPAPAPEPGASSPLGRRDWEHWHRWTAARIEQIVSQERALPPAASLRRGLAQVLAGLGDSLLDVGCGPGALWVHLEPYRPRFTWEGLDATEAMLATANRLFPDIPTHREDAARLPFAPDAYDVVLLRHVLEYLPPEVMQQALAEAVRVARKAIVLGFHVPPAAAGEPETKRVGEGFLETRWPAPALATPLREAGWTVADRFTLAGPPGETDDCWLLLPEDRAAAYERESLDGRPAEDLKISIILPTYRREHILQRTVGLIREQSYRNWELIIIDNAGDVKMAFDDSRIRVHVYTETASASYARNQGLRHATGDLVCFFDDDDDMFPSYLAQFAATFQAHTNAKMVRCGMIVSDGTVNVSYATPECCLRRPHATPAWTQKGPGQDQKYFRRIVAAHRWSERAGDVITIRKALCRANADPRGGLREGRY